MKESALAARAKAKKEADDKFFSDAAAAAKQIIAADEARRVAQAANLSDAPLRALADSTTPVPLPENAENVKFDGADGKLEFDSSSSVKAIAAFYRASLKSQGWKEQPSVINKSNMVVMEFSKGGKAISFTAMQMGPKVNVSADGSGLVMANAKMAAKPGAATNQAVQRTGGQSGHQGSRSRSGLGAAGAEATHHDARSEPARCPAATPRSAGSSKPAFRPTLNSVLAFYRSELGKRGWKEIRRPRRRQAGPGAAGIYLVRRAGDAETRPQQWRDLGQSRAEISGSSRQGRRHAEARTGQAGVRQYGRQRSRSHHQQADDQDRALAPADRNRRIARCSNCRRANTSIR